MQKKAAQEWFIAQPKIFYFVCGWKLGPSALRFGTIDVYYMYVSVVSLMSERNIKI
jgi:hypothetical protein